MFVPGTALDVAPILGIAVMAVVTVSVGVFENSSAQKAVVEPDIYPLPTNLTGNPEAVRTD